MTMATQTVRVLQCTLLVLCIGGTSLAADPSWYLRRATWHDSLLDSRDAVLRAETAQARAAGKTLPPRLGPWRSLGPFAELVAAREADILKTQPNALTAYPDSPSTLPRAWRMQPGYGDGLPHRLHEGDHVVYLRRTINSSVAAKTTVHLDAIGSMTAWLNGKPVMPKCTGRISYTLWGNGAASVPTAVPLELQRGENNLLVRVEVHPRPRPADDTNPWRKYTLEARRPWGTVFNGYETHSGPALEFEKLVNREVSYFYFSTSAEVGPLPTQAKRDRERLWKLLKRDFRDETARVQMAQEQAAGLWRCDWAPGDVRAVADRYAETIRHGGTQALARPLILHAVDRAGLAKVRELYHRFRDVAPGEQWLHDTEQQKTHDHTVDSLRLAITDLVQTHGPAYPHGAEYLARLSAIGRDAKQALDGKNADTLATVHARLEELRREALMANPLLDFGKLVFVKRRANPFVPQFPMNWANNSSVPSTGRDNEIGVLSPVAQDGELSTLYRPEGGAFVGDVDLNFDGKKLLFSMPGSHERWQVFEIGSDGTNLRQVTRGDQEDVDNFDACYLPNGKVTFCSTAVFAGVPCVRGRDHVGVLFNMNADGEGVRQLGFEQDQDWSPTVLNDGRVMYTRWEYTDIPHFFSRLLFSMNPDGTDQKAHYGSNSYWPNGIFYARPIPGHNTQIIGVVSGHHAASRAGELVLFDPAKGTHEADGVIQRIPGRGAKVEPVVNDRLVIGSWPKFLHPYPLSEKYFLVAGRMNRESRWGIYVVDVFDNMLPLLVDADYDILEPIPLRAQPRPPVIPDRVKPEVKESIVNLSDVYEGPGLAGVPRGAVKQLRVVAYHYAFQDMADDSRAIGVDASWDTVKLVLGTVPVEADGSAMFRVPANTPITVQPLDEEGKALQLMRSWMTAMPGETLSCVGCHAPASAAPPVRPTLAMQGGPSKLKEWYGPARGFSFQREVQPVLDEYCTACHDGKPRGDGKTIADLTDRESTDPRGFSPSYLELHRFVRRPGAETDYHLLPAAEYHADVSELVQLLKKGHHNVQLDAEAWDRLVTWIDLNVPYHGTWHEAQGEERVAGQDDRRRALRKLYAGIDEDPEVIPVIQREPVKPVLPPPVARAGATNVECPGWPFDAKEAQRRQRAGGGEISQTIDLGAGVALDLVRIPAGEFVMGDATGYADERPRRERIAQSFWIGKLEVTNAQFARFDAEHDSRYIRTHGISSTRGYAVNRPQQPVVRVSWEQAMAYCDWLSEKTDR
ncbi:MAG: hypothetical protein CMJ48_11275, partial [Planctomycetaceae bacterium]|nr:hypothetical protein [Planctomycetaceae bacterium]